MVKTSNENGAIDITAEVYTTIAGDAASSCFGVKGMAGKGKNDVWQLLRRESMAKGVEVHFAEDGTISVEMHIVVTHGVNLSALCKSIMAEVGYKVFAATSTPVTAVDVYIDSMIMD